MTVAGYMYVSECEKKENRIAECTEENKSLRGELEDTKFDLSVANEKIEQKDEIVSKLIKQAERNSYNNKEVQLNKIKELAKEYQAIN